MHCVLNSLMATTKLKAKEMGQIIETLPKEGKETLKSTYENIIDLGKAQGAAASKDRWQELKLLQLVLNAVQSELDVAFIVRFFEVPETLVKLIRVNADEAFLSNELAAILAKELFEVFPNLEAEDIATFCKLNVADVAK